MYICGDPELEAAGEYFCSDAMFTWVKVRVRV